MGSANIYFGNFYCDNELAYILGLWCADGYYWSSSIGLSNVDTALIERFKRFLLKFFGEERLKLKIYYPSNIQKPESGNVSATYLPMRKVKQIAYQIYANSRPLLRIIREARSYILKMRDHACVKAYFAGRFDGDGSVAKDRKSDCRIVYSNENEARIDQQLLIRLGIETRLYSIERQIHSAYMCREAEREDFLIPSNPFEFDPKIYIRTP